MKINVETKSIGNLLRLLATLQIENAYDERDVTVFHQRFDNEPDELFETFLEQLYPDGCSIDRPQVNALVSSIYYFMRTDERSVDLYIRYDKRHCGSWIYFIPEKTFRSASLGDHELTIIEICTDFFRGCEDIDRDYLKNFILKNFEIRSDNNTLEQIADDVDTIRQQILDRLLWTSWCK